MYVIVKIGDTHGEGITETDTTIENLDTIDGALDEAIDETIKVETEKLYEEACSNVSSSGIFVLKNVACLDFLSCPIISLIVYLIFFFKTIKGYSFSDHVFFLQLDWLIFYFPFGSANQVQFLVTFFEEKEKTWKWITFEICT